jgi:hypothetical protein
LHSPKEFSPDGELLLAGRTKVWEVSTGKLRFQAADVDSNFCTFSADSRWLIVEHRTKVESWLSWYDVATGEEQTDKRVFLQKTQRFGMVLERTTADGRLLLSTGSSMPPSPGTIRQQLARLPGLQSLTTNKSRDRWFLIDEPSGREVAHGDQLHCQCNPQGTLLLTTDRDQGHLLWDVPLQKPVAWFLAFAATLGLGVALVARWGSRHRPKDAPKEPAPAPASG